MKIYNSENKCIANIQNVVRDKLMKENKPDIVVQDIFISKEEFISKVANDVTEYINQNPERITQNNLKCFVHFPAINATLLIQFTGVNLVEMDYSSIKYGLKIAVADYLVSYYKNLGKSYYAQVASCSVLCECIKKEYKSYKSMLKEEV